jgi:Ca2+/H+ antiporter
VILPLIAFSLLLPDFTQTTPGPTLSIGQSAFVAIVAVGLYATFLALQTGRHRSYFAFEDGDLLKERQRASCRMSCCWPPIWCPSSTSRSS